MRKNITERRKTSNKPMRIIGVSSILVAVAIFMAMNFSVMVAPSSADTSAACATGGSISGTVFNDYNNNGTQDANEPGIPGVTVSGYLSSTSGTASAGTACETVATVGSEGDFSFEPADYPVRLEFTLPASLQTYLKAGPAGGTSVQFVSAASAGIDVGFHDPADYCEATFDFSTTCFAFGVRDNITTPQDAVISLNYATPGVVITSTGYGDHVRVPSAPHSIEAATADVGSVLGLAYNGREERLYASAWVKRHVELGPEGAGAIYVIDPATNVSSLYFDLNSLPGGPAGVVNNRPDAAPVGWGSEVPGKHLFFDVDAFNKVGTTGIGDIDISPDDNTLFAVNMGDKRLYRMPAGTTAIGASDVESVAIPYTCPNMDDARPMALGYNNGKMYVGSVCSGQSLVENLATSNPGAVNNITFTYSADFDTLFGNTFYAEVFEYDLATNTFNTTPVLNVDLTYQRGCIFRKDIQSSASSPNLCDEILATANWRPWQSDWTQVFGDEFSSGNTNNAAAGFPVEYPQPILSDIEFDGEEMILGFRDINGDRTGHAAGVPDTTIPAPGFPPTQTFRGAGLGDVLRACATDTGFALESNGACGIYTTIGANNNEGPGGGEYYWNDQTPGGPNNTSAHYYPIADDAGHEESSLGMLMQVAGQDQVVVPAVDVTEFYDSGFIYFGNTTGASEKRVKLFDSVIDFDLQLDKPKSDDGLLAGKGNGIGDLEAICSAAPIQVGNVIWLDENQNGVQDPGEPGAAGVTVNLYKDPDLTTPIATVVTDADGNYYFGSGPGTSSGSAVYNVGELLPGMDYHIVVEQNQTGTVIEDYYPTVPNASTGVNSDVRDSDGISTTRASTPIVEIPFTTGVIGENDHSFDLGFSSEPVSPIYRDWGDLPDTFTTSTNVNGPNHILVDGLRMGLCSDGETDGAPTGQAIGDDENQATSTLGGSGTCETAGDDEDGILFRTFTPDNAGLAICTSIDVLVRAAVPSSVGSDGVLNAWADLNGDGTFSSGEQFVTDNTPNAAIVDTTTALAFPAPSGGSDDPLNTVQAVVGLQIPCDATLVGKSVGFRFRFTGGAGIGGDAPFGQANNGEVEDYLLPVYGWDFGDSPECTDSSNPDCYETTVPPTLDGNYKDTTDSSTTAGGARHIIVPGSVRLGSSIDPELNGQVSDGDGDTNSGGDGSSEEDGWSATSGRILTSRWDNGQDGFLRVNLTQVDPTLGACVYGFIDWEGNGYANGVTSTGVQYVTEDGVATITFPATIERDEFFDGTGPDRGVYIRLRVVEGTGNALDCAAQDTDGNLVLLPGNASGYACSGEVEDYFLTFTPTSVTMQDFSASQASTSRAIFIIMLGALLAATAVALVGYQRSRDF